MAANENSISYVAPIPSDYKRLEQKDDLEVPPPFTVQ